MSSEMSSFYGGRRGFSFVLRKTFDGFDIPQPDTDPTVTDYTYGKAYYAVTTNNKFIITEDAEVGNVEIAEGKYLIKRNSYNYKDYMWEFHDNDGSKIDDTDYNFPTVIAQGLKQCFDKGINSLNEVGYSEYVIIDSVINMCNWDDPDNGKIFQRGGDPENLYNIKYVCQLTGPKGEQIIIDMDHYSIIEAVDPHLEMIYSEANEDLVPGSYVENDVKKFNDTINFAYTYVRNSLGDIEKCLIGFKIPTLVEEYTAKSIKPYENRTTDPETGEYYNYDLISEDPEYYIDNKWVHPFYQKWNIKIPHGYHGVNSDGFELVPSKTKPEKFGNDSYPGTAVYSDQELSQPFIYEGEPLILKTSYETIRGDSFIKGQNWMNILFNNQKLYVSINDCYRNILRYKETNFDNIEAGEITYYELDFFESGHIIINQNGNELPQRKNLEFIGQQVEVTDDSLNDKTIVNILRQSGGYFGTVKGQQAEGVKQVVVSEDQDFKLQNGTLLLVMFDEDNIHAPTEEELSISLNVNNTGANLIVQTEDYENYTNIAYGRKHYVNLYMYCIGGEDGEAFPIWLYIGSNIGQRRAEEGEKDFSLITTGDKYRWDIKLDDNPSFEPASTRTNIVSKESISTLFGKIQKWFADLKTVAFTNDYNDLDNKPDILQSDWEQSDSTAIDYIKNKPATLGHIVVDNDGDRKPNQPYLQFSGYTKVINDSLNEKTIISDAPIDIEWDDYIELSDADKANNHYLIHNAPGGGGGITVSQVVTQGDTNAVSGDAVYKFDAGPTVADLFNPNTIYHIGDVVRYNDGTTTKLYKFISDDYDKEWKSKTWGGLTEFNGRNIWTDGDNVYYSSGTSQYVLDKPTSTWNVKTWSGLASFDGNQIWTDGENVYYSIFVKQYVLDKSTSTWNTKRWSGLTSINGSYIWTDGENIYYSSGTSHYILDKSTSTWSVKTWSGLTSFYGHYIWTDGENIYCSAGSDQYVLDKPTSTWSVKTWSGLSSIIGNYIWTDGENIYYSYEGNQYILDKSTSTWSTKTWSGLASFYGYDIWTDGDNVYFSYNPDQYILSPITTWDPTLVEETNIIKLIDDVYTYIDTMITQALTGSY